MRYLFPPPFIAILLLLCYSISKGQGIKKISDQFDNVPFQQLVNKIQAVSGYHFFYDPSQTDSLHITITVTQVTIPQLLDRIFDKTDFHYAIDSLGRVFITRTFTILTHLPDLADSNRLVQREKVQLLPEEVTSNDKTGKMPTTENQRWEIGDKTRRFIPGKATIAGYVKDIKTGESIVGAYLNVDAISLTVLTDQFGYYSLSLPKGPHTIQITSTGMKETRRQVMVYADGQLNIDMQESITSLKTVVVSADKRSNTRSLEMGTNRLSIKTIKEVPVVFGEADVLKVILTLPGVTSMGEASNGFNVRGGSADQNLILFDNATIYNPSHLFGFFSAFNPDVVKGIELYKSSIPEKYGGRLSSVLDVTMPDGNTKKWSGTAGIGPLTSKLVIEGPIKKETTSLIAGGRTTYSNWLLGILPDNSGYRNSKANFYDASLRLTHIFDPKNTLYAMGYISSDRFNLNNDTTYKYGNHNVNLKWKHLFNNKSLSFITAGIDHYQYSITDDRQTLSAFRLGFDINQTYFRSDFTWSPGNGHVFSYGFNSIYYKLHPGSFGPEGKNSLVIKNTVPAEQGLESAIYLGDQYTVNTNLSINAGLRYSVFNYVGPHTIYTYDPSLPRQVATQTDSTYYGNGKFIHTYQAPEIRISARYTLSDKASLKFSFNTLQQYIHMLSNTVSISPTDIWKLSDPDIKPQQGRQYSLGYYHNFKNNTIETSVEVYYKQLKNYLDYKSGADLVLNHHIETDVFSTKGKAYGVELLIKKSTGRLNGWISYTWSRTFLKQDDPLAGEKINGGNYYPASFDKPHNANLIGNYRFSHRYSLSVNVIYSTGRPITLPLAVFNLGGSTGLFYSDRNQYRIPDYFRTDISVNIEGNHRIKKLSHNSWSIGIYNITGRQNAYSVYFTQDNGTIKGYKLSIFGTLIPFITYNIKF